MRHIIVLKCSTAAHYPHHDGQSKSSIGATYTWYSCQDHSRSIAFLQFRITMDSIESLLRYAFIFYRSCVNFVEMCCWKRIQNHRNTHLALKPNEQQNKKKFQKSRRTQAKTRSSAHTHTHAHVIDRLCDSIIRRNEKKSRDLCEVVVIVVVGVADVVWLKLHNVRMPFSIFSRDRLFDSATPHRFCMQMCGVMCRCVCLLILNNRQFQLKLRWIYKTNSTLCVVPNVSNLQIICIHAGSISSCYCCLLKRFELIRTSFSSSLLTLCW